MPDPNLAPAPSRWPLKCLPFLPLIGGLGLSLLYWPGLMTWDSIRQYDQALSGHFDDWHPPMMEWVWRGMTVLWPGPAPMLILQLGLYSAGIAGLAIWALRRARPGLATALCASTLLPLPAALMGEVIKDSQMTAALMLAAALALLSAGGRPRWMRIVAVLLGVFAATLRFNAFPAVVPILLVAAGPWIRASRLRMAATALVSSLALLAVMPLTNKLLHAERSDVELSLVIFDLAGITRHTGIDVFPPLTEDDSAQTLSRCYSPVKWDTFSWWVEPLCPIDFYQIQEVFQQHGGSPYVYLAGQIVRHPVAYAEHRLEHWNIATRFIVPNDIERPLPRAGAPNSWGYKVGGGPLFDALDRAAVAYGRGPPGWPWCSIALTLGLLVAARGLPSALAIRMLAGSGLLYALSYLLVSVAAELRYYLWTMLTTVLASAILCSDLLRVSVRQRWQAGLMAIAPLAIGALAVIAAQV